MKIVVPRRITSQEIVRNRTEAPAGSKARCVCHNRYLNLCPNTPPQPQPTRVNNGCRKIGHATRGKAEAHMRHILKMRTWFNKQDWKKELPLNVYRCRSFYCREKPWHVGHEEIK